MCWEIIYLLYMYKKDFALNNIQWLICLKNNLLMIKKNPLKVTIHKENRSPLNTFLLYVQQFQKCELLVKKFA